MIFFLLFSQFMLYLADVNHGIASKKNKIRINSFHPDDQLMVAQLNDSKATNPAASEIEKSKEFVFDTKSQAQDKDLLSQKQQVLQGTFKTLTDLNWAWYYTNKDPEDTESHKIAKNSTETENWTQFECTDCLQLEFNYQAYHLSKNELFVEAEILSGIVNFETF